MANRGAGDAIVHGRTHKWMDFCGVWMGCVNALINGWICLWSKYKWMDLRICPGPPQARSALPGTECLTGAQRLTEPASVQRAGLFPLARSALPWAHRA